MDLKEASRQIAQLGDLLIAKGIAVDATPPVRAPDGYGGMRVTWPDAQGVVEPMPGTAKGLEYYLDAAVRRCYTCMLYDGALLQMSYAFDGGELTWHRLCYLPCPCPVDEDLARGEPIADILEVYAPHLSEYLVRRPVLRFDYAPQQASVGHAACHAHIAGDSCRIPVVSPLCIGDFVSLVFMHYYPDVWASHDFLREWPRRELPRCLDIAHEHQVHLSWRLRVLEARQLLSL